MTGRTLIACLGNIFLGDDAFGVEVARRLARCDLPDGARVTDYGIRGMHLAYDLAEGFDTTILVDAVQRGGEPGTVYVIEPDLPGPPDNPDNPESPAATGDPAGGPGRGVSPFAAMSLFDAHGMQPDVVLSMAGMLGSDAGRVLLVGCEPARVDEGMGLSAPVEAAVDEAVRVVARLAREAAATVTGRPTAEAAPAGPAPGAAHAANTNE